MNEKDFSFVKGDTFVFSIELGDLAVDLASAFFTCKSDGSDSTNIFQKTLEDGITKVSDNTYRIRVAPEDTENVEAGKYVYDFQIGIDDDVYTIIKGKLTLEQDVTN